MFVPYIPPNITIDTVREDINSFNPPAANSNTVQSQALSSDRAWAEQQAQKQMDFQERMSNTAYQRAIADMSKAGLNPALAYQQGGANAPVGSLANTGSTAQAATINRENNLFKTLNSVISGAFGLANTAIKL